MRAFAFSDYFRFPSGSRVMARPRGGTSRDISSREAARRRVLRARVPVRVNARINSAVATLIASFPELVP